MDPRKQMLRPGVNKKTLQQNTKRGVHGPQETNVETRCQCEDITTEHKEGVHGPQKTNVETRCQCEDITKEHKEGRSWTPENHC